MKPQPTKCPLTPPLFGISPQKRKSIKKIRLNFPEEDDASDMED